jgi:hypothetical protein
MNQPMINTVKTGVLAQYDHLREDNPWGTDLWLGQALVVAQTLKYWLVVDDVSQLHRRSKCAVSRIPVQSGTCQIMVTT